MCKQCGIEKKRIPVGMYPDGRDIRHHDETGRPWNGHKCGSCDNDTKKADQKARRAQRRLVNQQRRDRYARSKLKQSN